MEKVYIDMIQAAINLNRSEVISLAKKIANDLKLEGNNKDSDYIKSIIGNTSLTSTNDIKNLLIVNKVELEEQIKWKNSNSLKQITNFLSNKEKLNKLNSVKIMILGKPGTGKTTFAKDIAKKLNFNLFSISASNLISYRLGETQKNIDKLLIDINNNFLNSIFIIDEFDSLIGSRNSDINNEYQRMIGSFNIFLDSLPKETVLIAISNQIDSIDKATLRRFNITVEMNEVEFKTFKDELFKQSRLNKIVFNEEIVIKILKYKEKELNYSIIENIIAQSLIYDLTIEKSLVKVFSLEPIEKLKEEIGLTIRELETLTSKSKSTIQRGLKINENN